MEYESDEAPKYRFIQSYATGRDSFRQGKVYTLHPTEANPLVRAGIAEEVVPDETPTVSIPSKRKGR